MASDLGCPIGTLVGLGQVINATDGITFPGHQTIRMTGTFEEVALPTKNFTLINNFLAMPASWEGEIAWHEVSAEQLGVLFGGTVTLATGISSAHEEAIAVPAVPAYTATLVNAATCIDKAVVTGNVVLNKDATGAVLTKPLYLRKVAGAPASGEFAITAGVITFNVAQASYSGTAYYLYTDTTGRTLTIPPTAMPLQWEMYAEMEFYFGENQLGPGIIHCPKVIWTGNIDLTAPRGGHDPITRAFRINNQAAGDLEMSFPW